MVRGTGIESVTACQTATTPSPVRICNVCGALDTVPVARAPDGAGRSAGVCVVMAVGAAGRWQNHPSSLGGYEVADEVVRELIARLGNCHVVPRTPDSGRGVPINGSDVAGRSGSCGRTLRRRKNISSGLRTTVALLRPPSNGEPLAPLQGVIQPV